MSSWKLVEAVVVDSPAPSPEKIPVQNGHRDRKSGEGTGRHSGRHDGGHRDGRDSGHRDGRHGGRDSGRDGRRPRRNPRNQPNFQQQMDAAALDYFSSLALQQIEFIFTDQNLCMDTFIRGYMDEAGFVPLAILYYYPNVASFGIPFQFVLQKIMGTPTSILEANLANETIKLKEKWDMWLMPNGRGGRGVPLYVQPFTSEVYEEDYGDAVGVEEDQQRQQQEQEGPFKKQEYNIDFPAMNAPFEARVEELSASAAEFKPRSFSQVSAQPPASQPASQGQAGGV